MEEAVSSTETLVMTLQATQYNNPEGHNLNFHPQLSSLCTMHACLLIFAMSYLQMYSAWYQAKCHIPWRHFGVSPFESCISLCGDHGVWWRDRWSKEQSSRVTTSTRGPPYSILCIPNSLVSSSSLWGKYIHCKFDMVAQENILTCI